MFEKVLCRLMNEKKEGVALLPMVSGEYHMYGCRHSASPRGVAQAEQARCSGSLSLKFRVVTLDSGFGANARLQNDSQRAHKTRPRNVS